jgi:ferredoxin-NADP reductase
MASVPSTLRIVASEPVGPSARSLVIERADGAPLAFRGGQYLIVNTGVALPCGKLVKRAYSLMPVPGDPARARLLVKRIGDGPGSSALHAAVLGSELLFSGPWGKLVPEEGLDDRTLVVATDTGITAALGVVEHAREAGARNAARVLWLREEHESFLDEGQARARIEAVGVRFVTATIPRVHAAGRVASACEQIIGQVLELGARLVIAAGDGAVLYPLRERLLAPPSVVAEVRLDCFFNNPERKVA